MWNSQWNLKWRLYAQEQGFYTIYYEIHFFLAASVFLAFVVEDVAWFKINENLFCSIFGLFGVLISQVEIIVLNVEGLVYENVISV